MKFCKYCGSQVPDDAEQCPQCTRIIGEKSSKNNQSQQTKATVKKHLKILKNKRVIALITAAVTILVIVTCIFNSGKCDASGCNSKAVSGMKYCYNHKCAVSDCNNRRFGYSNYCYSHYLLYDDDSSSSFSSKVYSYELEISDLEISSNSSYTIAEGIITNNSNETVSFVKIKGSFKNSLGSVVDTDWTYAVGGEGLAPGESCTWRMSVKKNYSVSDCSVSIIDFDY